jgi:putative SOS response-associated peptidase YedK
MPRRAGAEWARAPADQLHTLLRPHPAEAMEAVPVGRYVSNPRNEGPR